jgi:uncharacterized protein (DUF1697 family)
MRWVVFLRAANVGKHNRFQPRLLTEKLAKFGMINVGAVGTFAVRENVSESALRNAIAAQLAFKCDVIIRPAKEIIDLVGAAPFKAHALNAGVRPFLTIMAQTPMKLPPLPIRVPETKDWEVKIVQIIGCSVLSLWRRIRPNPVYPNQVVEKKFGVATTTRSWNTIEKLAALVETTSKQG